MLVSRNFSVVPTLLLLLAGRPGLCGETTAPSPPKITEARKDDNGFLIHSVESGFQKSKTEIQVLLPDHLEKGRHYPVIYVLPVYSTAVCARGNQDGRGNGLLEVKRLQLHNKYAAIFVFPTFTNDPWYFDNGADRQETYFLQVVLPFVEKQYPAAKRRLLLGFSKSGWGAFHLLLRHPDLFEKAAAFDAPFDKRIESLLVQQAQKLQQDKRLELLGHEKFPKHHQAIHNLMERLKIPHEYLDEKKPKHTWDAGWLEAAVAFLLPGRERQTH